MWNSAGECVDEIVLVIVCAVSLYQAVRWVQARLFGGKKYQKVARMSDAYGPDPGLELAEQAIDPAVEDTADATAASAAAAAGGALPGSPPRTTGGGFSATAAEADELFAEDDEGQKC